MAYWYPQYKRQAPREVRGGIKAQTQRGKSFGEKWWAKRWLEFIENSGISDRLTRGRSYARRGLVLDIQIEAGRVTAKVQGSRPRPYQVKIECPVLTAEHWQKVAEVFSKNTAALARLAAGSLPEDAEGLFRAAGVALFPDLQGEIRTECSCPDWSNPCKHTAAVYYLLAEEFDRDPFGLFVLRGKTREEFLALVKGLAPAGKDSAEMAAAEEELEPEVTEKLPAEVADFWGRRECRSMALDDLTVPPTAAALVKKLGNFPLWRGEKDFIEELAAIYGGASLQMQEWLTERES